MPTLKERKKFATDQLCQGLISKDEYNHLFIDILLEERDALEDERIQIEKRLKEITDLYWQVESDIDYFDVQINKQRKEAINANI